MKDWIKFFTLGFFSDKLTAKPPHRRVYSSFFALFFAFVLFVAVVIAADFIPFSLHYADANDFKNTMYNAFVADGSQRISLKVEEGKITAAKRNGAYLKDRILNSFKYEEDKPYSLNGYNLVIDTRPMNAYDAFEAEFDGGKISAEEYAGLSFTAKKNCSVKIRLTDGVIGLDEAFMGYCESYLEKVSSPIDINYDKALSEEYAAIKNSDDEGKADKIYKLYLRAYYPQTFDGKSGVPVLRNYYAQEFIENENVKNYLFVFEDMLVGSFTTESGISRMFYGYASKLLDGVVVTAVGTGEAEKQIDGFIDGAYRDSLGISSYLYFINSRRIFLFVICIWLILSLITFGISKLIKLNLPKKFGAWFKIIGSFIFISSLTVSFIAFICGFFVSVNTVFAMITPMFGAIMLIRLATYFITSCIKLNKEKATENDISNITTEISENAEVNDKNENL